ncbi:hypothetical protein EYF80_058610 [Liparis tanakae]|uniref:Uncharacterized protein n=1 Tax=Liparis tanakae TaxID=230148 RepID=A0A4Z2EQW7_9TELE|nr:hypothetical protein EYF80_058610 [Liparis tanakae]
MGPHETRAPQRDQGRTERPGPPRETRAPPERPGPPGETRAPRRDQGPPGRPCHMSVCTLLSPWPRATQ